MATLVTGAAGFIGYHLAAHLLARGGEVVGIDDFNAYYDPGLKRARVAELERIARGRLRMIAVDMADDPALDSALNGVAIDRIAHLAAQAGVRYSLSNPRAYARANMAGHLNLLEVARDRGCPMVYASSSSIYGGNATLPFRVEERADRPLSLYAATKRADELMSEAYAHLYRIPLTGLRFFTVYGPWGRPDMAIWLFTAAILAGRPIELFNGGALRRDFTYIDDIVGGIVGCLDAPPADDGAPKPGGSVSPHSLYNIGNARSEELERVVALIEQACEREAIRVDRPMQPGDVHDTFADISALAADTGFTPRVTIDEGIPRFVNWYRRYRG